MPQSLAKVVAHIIFSTKDRRPTIPNDLREKLNAYLVGALSNLQCPAVQVNCTADHVHILCCLSRTLTIARTIEEIKKESSKWVKTAPSGPTDFFWQAGYGAFLVSESNVAEVRRYILDQDEHHRVRTFQEEFRAFLGRHGVEYDERYVWD